MNQAEIMFPDGTKDTFLSFDLDVLLKALEDGEIQSFTIRKRCSTIAPNPFKKNL